MLEFEIANRNDAKILTEIQIAAFKFDLETCGSGPPGYDSIFEQQEKIREFEYYKRRLEIPSAR